MRDAITNESAGVRLVADGKYWGTLRILQGRLLLDCQRHGRQVQFDLLATVQHGQPVTGDDASVRHCEMTQDNVVAKLR